MTKKTKIQDELCEKRTLATIATHDLSKIKGDNLYYEAKDPNIIEVYFFNKLIIKKSNWN